MGRMAQGVGMTLVMLMECVASVEANESMTMQPSGSWVIESADYSGQIKDQIARMEVRYTIRLLWDGQVEIPIGIQGGTVTAIEMEKRMGEAHIVPRDGVYALSAGRKGVYRVHVTFSSLMVQDSQFEGIQLRIPRATFSTLSLTVPRRDIELRQADQLYVETHPESPTNGVKLVARLGAADWVDLRWKTKPTAPVKVEPVLYGELQLLAAVEEQLARLTSIIEYRMAQSAANYQLPELQLIGVKQERGYLAVARSGSVELSAETMEGINRVDVKELPEHLRSLAGSPVTLAFKYHQHPYRAMLALTRHDDHPVLAAIAERGELVTVLSRQGELMTRATYVIKANKKQFLEVILPKGAALWSCLVDERSVKPVEGVEQKLLVPLDASSSDAETVSVELVYFERRPGLTGFGRLTLEGPRLDVPTTVANWLLYAPRDVQFLRMSGNLDRGAAPLEFLENSLMQTASAEPQSFSAPVVVSGESGEKFARLSRRMAAKRARGHYSSDEASQMASNEPMGLLAEAPARSENDAIDEERKLADGKAMSVTGAGGFGVIGGRDDRFAELENLNGRLQERGIFPLKIRLPKAGNVYQFNRLMTTQDALTMETTFVHLRMSWLVIAAGLIMLPIGGVIAVRVRRA